MPRAPRSVERALFDADLGDMDGSTTLKPLRPAGATYDETADELGVDWRTVRQYLAADAPSAPPTPPRRVGTKARKIDSLAHVVDAWLTADLRAAGQCDP